MKKLVATIALLCLSNTVLTHDIYSNLRDRDGHLCCGGQDCKPVQAIVLPNGSYYLPASGETIPAYMATPSPDDHFHHCTYYPMANEHKVRHGPQSQNREGDRVDDPGFHSCPCQRGDRISMEDATDGMNP
jgi:hypothetical protein